MVKNNYDSAYLYVVNYHLMNSPKLNVKKKENERKVGKTDLDFASFLKKSTEKYNSKKTF